MEKRFRIDFLYEALAIMHKMRVVQDKDNDEEIYKNFSDFNKKDSDLNSTFSSYFSFKEAVLKQVDPPEEELNPYFEEFIYQTPFIMNFYRFIKDSGSDIKTGINGFFIDHLQELTNKPIDKLDLSSFIVIINNLELKDNEKLMVINFYINGEEIYNKILDQAKSIEKVIISNYHLIKDEIDDFIKMLQSKDLNNKLNELLKFDFFKNDDYIINVSIFYYNQLLLNQYNDNFIVYLGYLVFILNNVNELNKLEDKRVLSILKVISEPTRFKIIKLLIDKVMYVQEIATEVGLTSATLVHHLEILLSENLIEIVKNVNDKKRIFYKLNKKSIKHFIKILGETFK